MLNFEKLESALGDVVDGVGAGVDVASDEVVEGGAEENGSAHGDLHFLGDGELVFLKKRG